MDLKALRLVFLCLFLVSPLSAKEEDIVLGLVAPLTGDQSFIGIGMKQGAQLAIEDANIKGPLVGESKVRLQAEDDQHNPTQAVLAANKLIADPNVLAVVGHFNSSCTKAASAIYHEARLTQATPASTNPEISKQGYDTFFRMCATDDVQAPAAALFVKNDLGASQVVVLDDQTTYGRGLAKEFEKKFTSLGGVVIHRDGITQGDKDFMSLLTKVKAKKPDFIFFGGIYPEMALLLKQSKKVGLKATWIGGDGIYDSTLIQLASPELAEGVYATMLGVDPKSLPAAQDFVARYEARYGALGSYSAYGYDTAAILLEAIRRAGKKDREAVLAEMKKMKDHPGILGVVNFDKNGDAIGRSVGVFKVENGKFVFIKEMKPAE